MALKTLASKHSSLCFLHSSIWLLIVPTAFLMFGSVIVSGSGCTASLPWESLARSIAFAKSAMGNAVEYPFPSNVADAKSMAGRQTELESLLVAVQAAALKSFTDMDFDPKFYVDLSLKKSLNSTRDAFQALAEKNQKFIPAGELSQFLNEYFAKPGSDLLPASLGDYVPEPEGFLPLVKNRKIREWALNVHSLWLKLARKVSDDVLNHPEQHTLLPLPHVVVVPGARFNEVYYWDSYWIIRGLIVSRMLDTARGIAENLLLLVETYGFVPNGARTYYTNRSQPPLLSQMIRALYEASDDHKLVERAFPVLLREYNFWCSDLHEVWIQDNKGIEHRLTRYSAMWDEPRPESFTTDEEIAKYFSNSKSQQRLYHDIATAAESGWDFSSRWMGDEQHLRTLRTSRIIPVDLNAFLMQMEKNLAFFAKLLGRNADCQHFNLRAEARRVAINSIFWSDEKGQWFDYWLPSNCHNLRTPDCEKVTCNFEDGHQNKNIFASNFVPVWCGVLLQGDSRLISVVKAFNSSGLLLPAGVVTSLKQTGQQWDYPNAWAPLQHMIVEGFVATNLKEGKFIAESIARRWIRTNYVTFNATGEMQEKYDATVCGQVGRGGEYTPQAGFGWSNGVVLAMLQQYGWPENVWPTCE